MDIRHPARACALLPVSLFCASLAAPVDSDAATLARFSFDQEGRFTLDAELLHAGVAGVSWRDALGTLTDFAGEPGRALAISRLDEGNTAELVLTAAPGFRLAPSAIGFDQRVSASGPDTWQLAVNAIPQASGATTTTFGRADAVFGALDPAEVLVISFGGSGASSAAGTLRLDNVELVGAAVTVPLPPTLGLLVTPLLGCLLGRARMRCRAAAAALNPPRKPIHARRPGAENRAPA